MKKTLWLLSIMVMVSCKDTKAESNQQGNETVGIELESIKKDSFRLVMNLIVESDDVFEVYYYELGSSNFHSKDFVSKTIVGNSNAQTIVFELPEHMYPERLRLDFGKKPDDNSIKVNSFSLIYGSKEYMFSDEEIINQFAPSKFVTFDPENFIITGKEIDGRYDPYFYSPKLTGIVNYLLED